MDTMEPMTQKEIDALERRADEIIRARGKAIDGKPAKRLPGTDDALDGPGKIVGIGGGTK
jgi:hypothetical protein